MRDEIHAADWLGRNRSQQGFPQGLRTKYLRSQALREYVERVALDLIDIQIINIHIDKTQYQNPKPMQIIAWERLIQRFHNFLEREIVDGEILPAHGMIFPDRGNEMLIRRILRKMRAYNPVPSQFGPPRQVLTTQIVDDPIMRNSSESYFIQIADVSSHLLYRKIYPKGSLRRYNVDRLFDLLRPRLLLAASRYDPMRMGIVHIKR